MNSGFGSATDKLQINNKTDETVKTLLNNQTNKYELI